MADPAPAPPSPPAPSAGLKLLVNYGPLLIFFVANKFTGPIAATGIFMAASVLAGALSWWKTRHLPPIFIFSTAIVLLFGGLTLWLGDPRFIQVKPTIIYAGFVAILAFGLLTGRPTLKLVLEDTLPGITPTGWRLLTRNWALFFAAMAGANEVARRLLSFDDWLSFKIWGFTLAVIIFTFSQAPLMKRHGLNVD